MLLSLIPSSKGVNCLSPGQSGLNWILCEQTLSKPMWKYSLCVWIPSFSLSSRLVRLHAFRSGCKCIHALCILKLKTNFTPILSTSYYFIPLPLQKQSRTLSTSNYKSFSIPEGKIWKDTRNSRDNKIKRQASALSVLSFAKRLWWWYANVSQQHRNHHVISSKLTNLNRE